MKGYVVIMSYHSIDHMITYRIVKELEQMVGAVYKPVNQQVTVANTTTTTTTRSDKLRGQSSPTLPGSVNSHHWAIY